MKSTTFFLFAFLVVATNYLQSQNKQLLYDFYGIPQSVMVNPGVKTPYQWHAGIPILSNISFQASTSGITVNDLFANDGIDFTAKVRDRAVNSLKKGDDFGGSGLIEIFNGGFRSRNRPNDYYSFGMYGEGFVTVYWPEDLAILAFEGNANNLNRRFDLSHITGQGEAVNIFHFGINRKIDNRLTVGIRAKVYSSVFEFKSTRNKGYFVTTEGENNILANTLVADVQMRTSGIEEILDILDDDTLSSSEELSKLLLRRSFFGGNLGMGADFGFTYQLNPRTFVTGSLLDIGFIYHTKDVKNYTLKGAATNEGVDIILPDALIDPDNDLWQDLVDEIEVLIPFETNKNSYVSLRPIKLNASIRYNFGERTARDKDCDCNYLTVRPSQRFDYINSLGGHLFVINGPRGPKVDITGFYQKRLGNAVAVKATYTANKYTLANLGLGLNLQAGPLNFYLLADNLLGYQNLPDSNYASFQFGFNILSWNNN
ncbi:MAG: DUF5723 family protein [Bacteroidota bacterium]